MSDDLPRRLRVTAEQYRPDGDRMWSRVAAGMDEPEPEASPRPRRTRFRVPHLAVATGVAVVLIAVVVYAGYRIGPPERPNAAGPSPTVAEETTGEPDDEPSDDEPSVEESPSEEEPDSGGGEQDGPTAPEPVDDLDFLDVETMIHEDGNDYWSQAEMHLDVAEPVYEMDVAMRVALTDGVSSTGAWTTADHYFGQADVTEEDGYLVFRWSLAEDQTLAPGEYRLAGQYEHNGARDYTGDYYEFDTSSAADTGQVVGGFSNE